MERYKILYVEDDETLAYLTKDNLENYGFEVFHCKNGESALSHYKKNDFDICVLDIMLPDIDGFEIASFIRNNNLDIPIIFLSAKSLKEDRIKGLKLGADDYIIKPFSIEELILKIEVFLNRSKKQSVSNKQIKLGNYLFDFDNYTLIFFDQKNKLTQREAELLMLLIEQKNQVLKREIILKKIWGDDDYFLGRSLDVFISRLRKILSNDSNLIIENQHGIGFRLIENK